MPRPRKGTEDMFYDQFSSWGEEDRAAALKVLETVHRALVREENRNVKPEKHGHWNGQDMEEPKP